MPQPISIVTVAGSPQRPSRSSSLVLAIAEEVGRRVPATITPIEVSDLAASLVGPQPRSHPIAGDALTTIESADLLVVSSPVYRASYTGLFKHLFDLVDQRALAGRPVLLAATGGSERHSLVIEHQFRPLFDFFGALSLPASVYTQDSEYDEQRAPKPELRERIAAAVTTDLPFIEAARR